MNLIKIIYDSLSMEKKKKQPKSKTFLVPLPYKNYCFVEKYFATALY